VFYPPPPPELPPVISYTFSSKQAFPKFNAQPVTLADAMTASVTSPVAASMVQVTIPDLSGFVVKTEIITAQASSPAPVGKPPSLQTEPTTPQEKPFQPTQLPSQSIEVKPSGSRFQGSISPGSTIGVPSAYGQTWGSVGIGFGFQERIRFNDISDGVVGIVVGLGDPRKTVGFDVGLTSVSTLRRGLFDAGTFSFKLHRALPDDFAIAVGIQNPIIFGVTDGGTSPYGVVSKMFRLEDQVEKPFSRLYMSVGLGGGQFRSESNVQNQIDAVGVFGSIGVRVVEPVNAIVEWTGQDLTVGLSIAPFRNLPILITPAFTDITGNAGDGSRFILGVGYGLSF
jgi:hypothetical protein